MRAEPRAQMPVQDPNNPHPAYSADWVRANRRYGDEVSRRAGPHPACFPAGTPVLTAAGARPIERIRVGDPVLAVGPGGGLRPRPVCRVVARGPAPLLEIHWVTGRTPLAATAHHAFSCRRGWVRGRDLRTGDLVRRIDGPGRSAWQRVARTEAGERTADVFNLIVERDLTFIAGGYLVHSFAYARRLRTAWHRLRLAAQRRRPSHTLLPSIEPR